MDALQQRIGYQFADIGLLRVCLTHKSHSGSNNERLEFLGDAVLDVIVSHDLFVERPSASEHDLTLMRASLVKRQSLALIARQLELGEVLLLGSGEMKSGGHRRESILADALEALIGAVYLDGGFDSARMLVRRLFADQIAGLDVAAIRDAKTRLQELLQGRGLNRPRYEVIGASGADHARRFEVRCEVPELALSTVAQAGSRRAAEKAAAGLMLDHVMFAADGGDTTAGDGRDGG